jgi:hypothetical protein
MMGFKSGQKELFSYSVDLDQRVHSEHPLRKVSEVLDFGFVREQTACFYGRNGNESVDPVVVMKLMFLLFYDNINSERELMQPIITDSRGPGGEGCGGQRIQDLFIAAVQNIRKRLKHSKWIPSIAAASRLGREFRPPVVNTPCIFSESLLEPAFLYCNSITN